MPRMRSNRYRVRCDVYCVKFPWPRAACVGADANVDERSDAIKVASDQIDQAHCVC